MRRHWVPETVFPFESRFASVAGARLHYVDEGAGPPLVMLDGNTTWSFLYRDVVRGLRDRFRWLALDLPGFGLSAPPPGYRFTPAEHAADELIDAIRAWRPPAGNPGPPG